MRIINSRDIMEAFEHRLTRPIQARRGLAVKQEYFRLVGRKAGAQPVIRRELQPVQRKLQQPL